MTTDNVKITCIVLYLQQHPLMEPAFGEHFCNVATDYSRLKEMTLPENIFPSVRDSLKEFDKHLEEQENKIEELGNKNATKSETTGKQNATKNATKRE